jgi:hypothetical protein
MLSSAQIAASTNEAQSKASSSHSEDTSGPLAPWDVTREYLKRCTAHPSRLLLLVLY